MAGARAMELATTAAMKTELNRNLIHIATTVSIVDY